MSKIYLLFLNETVYYEERDYDNFEDNFPLIIKSKTDKTPLLETEIYESIEELIKWATEEHTIDKANLIIEEIDKETYEKEQKNDLDEYDEEYKNYKKKTSKTNKSNNIPLELYTKFTFEEYNLKDNPNYNMKCLFPSPMGLKNYLEQDIERYVNWGMDRNRMKLIRVL